MPALWQACLKGENHRCVWSHVVTRGRIFVDPALNTFRM